MARAHPPSSFIMSCTSLLRVQILSAVSSLTKPELSPHLVITPSLYLSTVVPLLEGELPMTCIASTSTCFIRNIRHWHHTLPLHLLSLVLGRKLHHLIPLFPRVFTPPNGSYRCKRTPRRGRRPAVRRLLLLVL